MPQTDLYVFDDILDNEAAYAYLPSMQNYQHEAPSFGFEYTNAYDYNNNHNTIDLNLNFLK
jgi:hypothetical protein